MNTEDETGFTGAKIALFLGQRLVVILRDDLPGLPFAGQWDLPGGGREGQETPFNCVQRECHEELGLTVLPENVLWKRRFLSENTGDPVWFFVARLRSDASERIVFGDEGQEWRMMEVAEFMRHPKGITAFQDRLRLYFEQMGELPAKKSPRCLKRGKGDEHQEDRVRRGVSPVKSVAPTRPIT